MRYAAISLLFIVLVSLCAIPNIFPKEEVIESGVSIIDSGSPDVFLKVEAVPSEVKSERSTSLIFEVRNKNNFDLRNLTILAYDQCIFTGEKNKKIDLLKANETETWTWKWTAGSTELDKDCDIKFRSSYRANIFFTQDIVVLSEGEYHLRELQGTLESLPVQSYFPASPLHVDLTFPEVQPFVDNERYYMFIGYSDAGEGIIDLISFNITYPKNTEVTCNNFRKVSERNLVLDKKLEFLNKKGPTTTCTFDTISSTPITIDVLELNALYEYKIDSSMKIKVKKALAMG